VIRAALLVACALAPLASAQREEDDLLPATVDALLALPLAPSTAGVPSSPPTANVFVKAPAGTVRALADAGDVTGDGAADLAVGFGPGGPAAVQLRDGRSGALLWSATPDGGSVRSLRGLSARDGRLALGLTSLHARVELRSAADGALLWFRDLLDGSGPPRNVLAVELVDDLSGDGVADVLCAGGLGLQVALLLSGADGTTLWEHDAGGPVADVRPIADVSGDGVPDAVIAGGVESPFARALSGADGRPLWSIPLAAPATVLLPLPDVDDDGRQDVAVGLFHAPGPCLVAHSGATGELVWEASAIVDDVTSLATAGDSDGDGLPDIAVGSLDNATSLVQSVIGLVLWRLETSEANAGCILSVANPGDLDGNGADDVLAVSLDEHAYLFDGKLGFALFAQPVRARGVACTALADGNGDGRSELAVGGERSLRVLDGSGGIVQGPHLELHTFGDGLPSSLLIAYAYPGKMLWLFGSLGPPGAISVPGYGGTFVPDLATLVVLGASVAPAAGANGYNLPPLTRDLLGLEVLLQGVTVFAPGDGLIGLPVSWIVGG